MSANPTPGQEEGKAPTTSTNINTSLMVRLTLAGIAFVLGLNLLLTVGIYNLLQQHMGINAPDAALRTLAEVLTR